MLVLSPIPGGVLPPLRVQDWAALSRRPCQRLGTRRGRRGSRDEVEEGGEEAPVEEEGADQEREWEVDE